MSTENLVIIAVLLLLLAEVTFIIAKLPRQTSTKKRMIFIDTSVLIDGRILPVAASGFIGDTVAIPRSVIGELQFLADNADHEKRARARHGLDVAKELQDMDNLDTIILQDGSKAEEGVDERLLNLAKKYNGSAICTIDYNLNKVAVVEGITVLNINELAQGLRMSYLPGERMLLEIVQKGQDSHQGVGYLKDGTMVVVEHANKNIGQSVEIEFIRSLQTAAGKMMFAKPVSVVQTVQPASRVKDSAASKVIQEAVVSIEKTKRPNGRKVSRKQPAAQSEPLPQSQVKPVQPTRQTANVLDKNTQPKRVNKPQSRRTSAQREAALIDLVDKQ